MKRLDYKLDGDLLIKSFPTHRVKERKELLIIILEAIRYILVADKIDHNVIEVNRLVAYIDYMQRLFFFSDKRYFSVALPFTLKIYDDKVSFSYQDRIVDAELISNIISVLNSEMYDNQDCLDFMTPIDEYGSENIAFWSILKYLMTYDLGYLRFDEDEKSYLSARRRGIPKKHPKFHLDINFSNSATFKSGLSKKINQQEFIDIVDNKKDRWLLIEE